jgi:hypothetical protein
MTRRAFWPIPIGVVFAGLAMGAAAGLSVAAPAAYIAVGVAIIATVILFARTRARSEFVVSAYWITFCLFSTMLAGSAIPGQFYPFYGALVLGAVVALAVGGLRVHAVVVWVYVAFLFLVLFSLLGYTESIAPERLIVFPFGALVLLQFRSSVGLRSVAFAAIAASLTVSIWVIVRAVQGDFEYRGNIDVNQNVVSVYIGLGFMATLAERVHGYHGPRRGLATALVVLALGVMAYALVLLASRGMIIAIMLASFALFVRVAWIDRGRLRFFLVLLVVATLGLLLPGGAGVFARFEDPNTITGGGRVEIWAAIGEELTNASFKELLIGHGFESSQRVVQRRFATLTSAHNAYLQVLFDYGLLGLILFLTLHGHAIARSWTIRGRDGALILGLVTFLLASNLFMTTPDNFMYWTALGFVLAIGSWHESGAHGAPPIPSGGADPMATSSRNQDPTGDQ